MVNPYDQIVAAQLLATKLAVTLAGIKVMMQAGQWSKSKILLTQSGAEATALVEHLAEAISNLPPDAAN